MNVQTHSVPFAPKGPDSSDVRREHGPGSLVEGAEAARPVGEKPRPKWKSAADRALTIGGITERIPFTLPTLNAATRGGLSAGKVVAVGGQPGGGKTSWLMQEAVAWAQSGILVGILAADEDADGLLIRIGQQLGIERSDLEEGRLQARAQLHREMLALPNLVLVDAEEEEGATLEALAEELALRRTDARPAVLILDSLQTITADAGVRPRDPRDRIDAVVKMMKRVARRFRHVVIATSEVSRGSYNTEDKSKRTSPLAAFKESGGVEYGVALALVLARFAEEGKTGVEVICAKNRLGSHGDLPTFRLEMSARRASFSELPSLTEQEKEQAAHALETAVRGHVLKILERAAVRRRPLTSASQIWEQARDEKLRPSPSRNVWFDIIRDMLAEGVIAQSGKRGPLIVVPS